jgi:hypothetical protein
MTCSRWFRRVAIIQARSRFPDYKGKTPDMF